MHTWSETGRIVRVGDGDFSAGRGVKASDVARVVGTSRSTVSRAFNPDTYVKPALRQEIIEQAARMGYQPNAFASALISRRSPVVGIVLHDFANPFHAELYGALTREMQRAGLTPLTAQLGHDRNVDEALSLFRKYQAKRVVLTSFAITEDILGACLRSGLEVLLLNRSDDAGRTPAVCADLTQGGQLAAERVAASGRRRVAILDGLMGSWTAQTRADGYLRGLDAHGLTPVVRLSGDYSYASGFDAAGAVRDAQADAALCANDLCAFGLIDGLRALGLRVPDDIAVVGFDDVPMAAWAAYDLTTVRLPVQQMVARAVQMIVQPQDDPRAGEVFVPCRLVERSTA